jgi:hypothetical protein
MIPSRFLLSLVGLVFLVGLAQSAPEKVVPNRNWTGIIRDAALRNKAPANGLITDAKTFEKVWKAWCKDEKVPEVDFKKEFVLVTCSSGPNNLGITATLDDGKLSIRAAQTRLAGPGFGYSLATFSRKGITTVNGTVLPKE